MTKEDNSKSMIFLSKMLLRLYFPKFFLINTFIFIINSIQFAYLKRKKLDVKKTSTLLKVLYLAFQEQIAGNLFSRET